MLTAKNAKEKIVLASTSQKSDGPFYCPDCESEMILHKGRITIHHFKHKSHVRCEYGNGESEVHRRCKYEIFTELSRYNGLGCVLEKSLGKVRPDVFMVSKKTGNKCAIEVQISALTMDKIMYRTRQYESLGIYVLWLSPYSDDLDSDVYAPKSWEKWVHATYFGRVYYWLRGLSLLPIHFGEHRKWVEESVWFEPGGEECSAGGYFKTQKRTRTICKGPHVQIPSAFKPTIRNAWASGDIVVPQCRILLDKQPAWWKGK